ncbi:hypothetical protein FB192DRAFT_1349761 [Mucor lusitanicus]|uniref:Uncharacterized protein n=1 Tax=Mucor circinelloides f. lusitanicus TaxID=29924 RepID=A0A8H4F4X5_MUCCL|nr:hypothetical protein FB192DRAFT_1349761 [Mucor lusitanicus]
MLQGDHLPHLPHLLLIMVVGYGIPRRMGFPICSTTATGAMVFHKEAVGALMLFMLMVSVSSSGRTKAVFGV